MQQFTFKETRIPVYPNLRNNARQSVMHYLRIPEDIPRYDFLFPLYNIYFNHDNSANVLISEKVLNFLLSKRGVKSSHILTGEFNHRVDLEHLGLPLLAPLLYCLACMGTLSPLFTCISFSLNGFPFFSNHREQIFLHYH